MVWRSVFFVSNDSRGLHQSSPKFIPRDWVWHFWFVPRKMGVCILRVLSGLMLLLSSLLLKFLSAEHLKSWRHHWCHQYKILMAFRPAWLVLYKGHCPRGPMSLGRHQNSMLQVQCGWEMGMYTLIFEINLNSSLSARRQNVSAWFKYDKFSYSCQNL